MCRNEEVLEHHHVEGLCRTEGGAHHHCAADSCSHHEGHLAHEACHEHEHHHEDVECCTHEHHHEHYHGGACHEDACGCGHNHGEKAQKSEVMGLLVSVLIWASALIFQKLNILDGKYLLILYVLAYLISGYKVVWQAIKNISKGKVFDENFLMTIASLGAFYVGEYPEASAVMLFYNLGELIQDYAVRRSRNSITDLMDIRAEYAVVLRENKEYKVEPSEVEIGEVILVGPAERVAVDGEVIEGVADIDTRALTGETVPRVVQAGSQVLAGMVNISGVLKIRTTKTAMDSAVSKILRLTDMAVGQKAKSEKFISKFARYYTPAVVGLAVLIFAIPTFIHGMSVYQTWLYRALAFLVTSCPCALVISIPLSFFAGIGGASGLGVLVKGANYIDLAAEAKTVVLDKTGTLTKGSFRVNKLKALHIKEEELKRLLLSMERYSKHPIAEALKTSLSVQGDLYEAENLREKAGRGVVAVINNKEVMAGNELLMKENGIETDRIEDFGTVVHLAVDKEYKGWVLLSDTLKPEAKQAVKDLKRLGIDRIVMLTGDEEAAASMIAGELDLTDYKAGVLPDEKLAYVQALKSESEYPVIFVGDGLNDAPVLAASDIGMAMGQIGTDAAIEAADVVIMRDDVTGIVSFIKQSVKTMSIVRQNIVMVLLIKMAVLVLAGLGLVGMWAAIFADVGVALLAVLNSVRAIRVR